MILPQIGAQGQARLAQSTASIVGVGALGCAIADHLVRAGVGRIVLFDRDCVELSNLHRQVLFCEADAREGLPKAEAARRRLAAINSQTELVAHVADLTPRNAEQLVMGGQQEVPGAKRAADEDVGALPDVLLDGTDNFQTRYLLNDLAVKYRVPFVYGGAVGTHGMQMTIVPGRTACLRCVFEQLPAPGTQPTCETAGVLGPVVSIVAACQAADALRLLLGQGEEIAPTLLDFDIWQGRRHRLNLANAKRSACPCCGRHEYVFLDAENESEITPLCGQHAVQVWPRMPGAARVGAQDGGSSTHAWLDFQDLAARFEAAGMGDGLEVRPFMLRCRLKAEQTQDQKCMVLSIFRDGRAIIAGTTDPARARSVYAKYIGI